MEEPIIEPVSKELLKSELTPERQLRMTNKSNNEIYIITAHNAPNVMREIGRLREIAFREAGGGTGKSMDIDEFDTMPNATGGSMPTASPSWPPATCFISLRSFSPTICPTPSSWAARS